MKTKANYYAPGQWNALCQRCGYERKSSALRLEWTGLRVCADDCWEPRHPQDYVRGVRDKQSPPWTSPEPADVFLSTNEVTPESL